MKGRYLIPALLAFSALALGQVQVLPEVEIQGDAKIRLPLIKKPMNLERVVSDAESLPNYFPSSLSETKRASILPCYPPRKATFKAVLSTDFGSDLAINWYPRLKHIPVVKFSAGFGMPGSSWLYQQESLDLGIQLNSMLGLNTMTGLQYALRDDYEASGFYLGVTNRYDSLRIGNVKLTEINTSFGYDHYRQEVELDSFQGDHLNLNHRHRLNWNKHQLKTSILLSGKAFGTALQYRALYQLLKLPELEYAILTDYRHIFPSIVYNDRFDPARNLILDVYSKPQIETMSANERMRKDKWVALGTFNRISSIPLNIGADLYYWIPAGKGSPTQNGLPVSRHGRIGISQQMRYVIDAPTLDDGGYAKIPRIRFTDVFENTTTLSFDYTIWNTVFSQNIELKAAHLPDQGMKRKPYSPAIKASNVFSRRIYDIDLKMDFTQEYFTKDHLGNDLNPITDLSLSGEYRVIKNGLVFVAFENIFGTPRRSYTGLPGKGRNLTAGFRYVLY